VRTNVPATRRERLWDLLHSRTYTDPIWTLEELAVELCCSVRTVRRCLTWLQDEGRVPRQRNYGINSATAQAADG
jgi:MarR-like DNA-binding transcriptional regulator SgrR of sgrS sRNA